MTDKEIIKALECCCGTQSCSLCPFWNNDDECNKLERYAFDLINRQQADNERLKKLLAEEEAKYNECAKRFYKEGVKELAKMLKNYYINHKRYKRPYAHTLIDFLFGVIDNLVAEMVGDAE